MWRLWLEFRMPLVSWKKWLEVRRRQFNSTSRIMCNLLKYMWPHVPLYVYFPSQIWTLNSSRTTLNNILCFSFFTFLPLWKSPSIPFFNPDFTNSPKSTQFSSKLHLLELISLLSASKELCNYYITYCNSTCFTVFSIVVSMSPSLMIYLKLGQKSNWSLFPLASCFTHSCQAVNVELNLCWEKSLDYSGLN